ncbi:MAG: Zn-dependent hydrolase [Thermoleophilaceae bacterium]
MDPQRVIADLRELDRRTGGSGGARRVCWTSTWTEARDFLRELLGEMPALAVRTDAAGNLFAELPGERTDEVVLVGSHLDSVPAGGWLDGALGVMAAVEVLRRAAEGATPPRTVALVDWADEEGARFGRSLLGSSAFAGTLDPGSVHELTDAHGVPLPDALAEHGVQLERMAGAGGGERERLAAYLELHIEQGPVLEAEGLACGAVLGTMGVERHRVTFEGRSAHAGSTPMDRRRDAGVAAARTMVELQQIGERHGGVCTAGRLDLDPGVVTIVPGRAQLLVDQRNLEAETLAQMLEEAREAWEGAGATEGATVAAERIWAIEPVPFHPGLVEAASAACAEAGGSARKLASGALHDASEMARLAPTAMVFAASRGGVSHAADEDTSEEDLAAALTAFGLLARRVIEGGAQ